MKIVNIFVEKLFAVVYNDEVGNGYQDNEYDRLLDLWTDVNYLREFAKENKVKNVNQFVEDRLRDAENIDDLLHDLTEENLPLDNYFHQLDNNETGFKLLSLRKGKASSSDGLRLYAIKIDTNCFLITGGAIKMSLKMKDHPNTREELNKIERVKEMLKENDVIDRESFYEFKNEQNQ
ncbi:MULTISPECIES: calponin homology domain-containing protein [Galbibacter]|uniref:Uncharacterized protein n=1 Tax=Galbibacter orientalis DSM 19592 TaxID=926559 RepID=I3C3D1_9FLAO|nr:hypothetical protein [Galbibacter orientalis]EIJ38124.1 hypothetical protein JoomaDRAFT_1105 [Galbibacter orientalis DSM 19592]